VRRFSPTTPSAWRRLPGRGATRCWPQDRGGPARGAAVGRDPGPGRVHLAHGAALAATMTATDPRWQEIATIALEVSALSEEELEYELRQ